MCIFACMCVYTHVFSNQSNVVLSESINAKCFFFPEYHDSRVKWENLICIETPKGSLHWYSEVIFFWHFCLSIP